MTNHKPSRKGMTSLVAGIAMVILLVVGIASGYFVGTSSANKTVTTGGTATVTTTVGAGATVTTTATVQGTGTGSGTGGSYQSLEQLAKSEGGSLTIYGLVPTPIFNQYLTTAFQQAFPWAKVTYSGLNAATLETQALSEYQANKVQADVICGNTPNIYSLNQSGVIQPFQNPEVSLMGNYSSLYNNPWYQPANVYPLVLAYNTNLVSASQVPKSWLDLNNSIFKGKVAFQDPSAMGSVSEVLANMQNLYNMTSAQWQSWAKSMVANSPILPESGDQVFTDLVDGQAAIGVVGLSSVFPVKAGEPIAVDWLPQYFSTSVPCSLAAKAPQPNTGRLFLEWLASYQGQLATINTLRTPAFPPLLSQWSTKIQATIPTNTTLLPAEFPQFFSNFTFYQNFYKTTFG